MPSSSRLAPTRLPDTFEALSALAKPRAIASAGEHDRAIAVIDALMSAGRLNREQRSYLETLVQLVEAYESKHHAILATSATGAVATLRHLLDASDLTSADLSRILGVHRSMGSKLLNGSRALTVAHVRVLADHFAVGAEVFID
jgi:antitoxin component HigA of HigAB toxin-antitoxin module